MIRQWFKARFNRILEKQKCATLLSRSFCMGTYIAFSPFIGLHTLMVFLFSWLMGLECATVFTAAWLINNPWTMLPVYAFGYNVGEYVLGNLCGIDTIAYNPSWIEPLSSWLGSCVGTKNLSFLSFVVGGNLVGIGAALALFPFIKRFFEQIIHEKNVQK